MSYEVGAHFLPGLASLHPACLVPDGASAPAQDFVHRIQSAADRSAQVTNSGQQSDGFALLSLMDPLPLHGPQDFCPLHLMLIFLPLCVPQ